MPSKLHDGQIHILKLIARDKLEDGWTPISELLYKPIRKEMPEELLITEKRDIGGVGKLTEEGNAVVSALKWLR